MKKIISMLAAAGIAVVSSVMPIMAEETTLTPATHTSSTETTFQFTKKYVTSEGTVPSVIPNETLKFEVIPDEDNPDDTSISVVDYSVEEATGKVTVTVPSYKTTGKWNYTVKEKQGNTQGVTYDTNGFTCQVFVSYDDDQNLVAQTAFTKLDGEEAGEKVDYITNIYDVTDPGVGLKVEKVVEGNLADKEQEFAIDVTFTTEADKEVASDINAGGTYIKAGEWELDTETGISSVTKTVYLADGETAQFGNLPSGIGYKVEEDSKHLVEDKTFSDPTKGYTVTYTEDEGPIELKSAYTCTVKNTKGTEIKTGIFTDNTPYIALIAMVAVGIVFFIKRRKVEE